MRICAKTKKKLVAAAALLLLSPQPAVDPHPPGNGEEKR